ncbi:MAG: hypothetical protein QM730_27125 [Anaerolineales bacterium]
MTILFASAPRPVLACEPTQVVPGYTPPTPIPLETQVAGASQSAQIVLDGTLKSWVPGSDMNSILTVQVEQYLKGHGPKTVLISGYFWECAPNFALQTGSRYVFFVDGDPASTKPLQARNWFVSQEAVVTSVRNASGQVPRAPDGTYDLLWFSVPIVILLGLILFLRYRRMQG